MLLPARFFSVSLLRCLHQHKIQLFSKHYWFDLSVNMVIMQQSFHLRHCIQHPQQKQSCVLLCWLCQKLLIKLLPVQRETFNELLQKPLRKLCRLKVVEQESILVHAVFTVVLAYVKYILDGNDKPVQVLKQLTRVLSPLHLANQDVNPARNCLQYRIRNSLHNDVAVPWYIVLPE